jgi:predicted dehydrogenase
VSSPVELAVVGAGLRGGLSYGPVALRHPAEVRFVDVIEPNEVRRRRFSRAHGIPPERCFARVEDWLAAPRRAEAAVVATPDIEHVTPALAALEAGYDVLVEKPLAPTAAECLALVEAAERAGRRLEVCHVLRYTAFFQRLHEVVAEEIGEVVTFEHRENIAYWHMAHSYVRGAYADTGRAAPFLLAKCCHDLDIMTWNMEAMPTRVASAGSLVHFRPEHAPAGAPGRCTDGCPVEATCNFSAPFVYLGRPDGAGGFDPVTPFSWMPLTDHGDWDRRTGQLTETAEERLEALRTGPFGRCVYACDNNAPDHQVVMMEFPSGATGTLVLHGHSDDDQRTLRYDGSTGTVTGRFGDYSGEELTIHRHRGGAVEPVALDSVAGLHGGGDIGLIRTFAASLRGAAGPTTGARQALRSHLLGFAAEEARRTATVVETARFERDLHR